ncbi:betaine-aldehyde dehydrogenase [Lentibacillus halophilus]
MYINGEWVKSKTGETRKVINPYNQEVIDTVAEGNREDTIYAIQAARKAFNNEDWRQLTGEERGDLLYQIAQSIRKERDELARLETLNTGKVLTESIGDIDGVANVFQYYAGLADKDGGSVINSPNPNSVSRVVREPVGVCGLISPWNFPLLQLSYKVAPAIAAGNTMVIKPSELTPLTTIKLIEIMEEVGFPSGVINLVLGQGSTVGQEIAESLDVDLVSFTGGTETGRTIMQAATSNFKKTSLELGGNSPNIIFADAQFETAVDYALNAIFFTTGQACNAGTRLLVEKSIHNEFVNELVKRAKNIRMGDGLDPETEMGPLVSAAHLNNVDNYIQIAIEEGAELAVGGKRPEGETLQKGFFIEPTIFNHCHSKMSIVQEETFGPILTIETFDTEEEAIQLGNDTRYGLAAAVWTEDTNRAERVVGQLLAGTVWVNDFHINFPQAPWGGYKQSGIGREMGKEGLEEYTELKHVYKNTAPQPMGWFGNQ